MAQPELKLGEMARLKMFDALCSLEFDEAVAAERLHVQDAHWVRLGEHVHVSKVSKRRRRKFLQMFRVSPLRKWFIQTVTQVRQVFLW